MDQKNSKFLTVVKLMAIANGLLFVAIVSSKSSAQTSCLSPEKRQQIESTTSRFMAVNNLPGISVAVVESGQCEWSKGFGMADIENSVPATSSTLYRLASISKPITATAAMQLYERERLDLDASVQKYLLFR